MHVRDRLAEVATQAPALAAHVERHLARGATFRSDGALLVAPSPWVAPVAHTFWLFPAAPPEWIEQAPQMLGVAVPQEYASLLGVLNGCFAYGLNLYGVASPASQGQIDRTMLQALQLHVAFGSWTVEYGQVRAFHFGGRSWSETENVGYFLDTDGPFAALKSGRLVGRWPSIQALLEEELPEAERRYPRAH